MGLSNSAMSTSNKKKVLIVEDETSLRAILALELTDAGYEVFEAENGQVGFDLAREFMPDLIITDVIMPKVDGSQLLKKLRSDDSLKHIPCIILTIRSKMRDYFEAVEVDEFLEKPFRTAELLATVQKILYRSHQPRNQTPPLKRDDKCRVLILEEDDAVLPALTAMLENKGYAAKRVKSVAECLEEAVRFAPHIIVSKYLLEGLSGSRLVDILRGMSHLKTAPIVLYSNSSIDGERENSLAAGANVFLSDVSDEDILKKIDILMNFQRR